VRITLDTNVLMSGHSPGSGEGRQLLLKILRGQHRLVLSQTTLYELEEVLHHPRIRKLNGLTDAQIREYLSLLTDVAELVNLGPTMAVPLTDRDDWMALRTAIDGNADVLCTNDGGFYKAAAMAFCRRYAVRVLKPSALLEILNRL
jgi:putative PIN family toxin of toxin-antitoxin system